MAKQSQPSIDELTASAEKAQAAYRKTQAAETAAVEARTTAARKHVCAQLALERATRRKRQGA